MLAEIEELTIKCLNDVAKTHIREATKCYEAGAYRASIVLTYVAVCFDLIEKLRALAAGGDAEAMLQIENLEKFQTRQAAKDRAGVDGLLAFERNLIGSFKDKFQFFGTNEHEEMERLQKDRNRCAHPTFQLSAEAYRPSAELARLHIRNALELVLTQEPRQGKAALQALQNVVLSSYFPKNVDDAVVVLRASPINAARPALVIAFIDDLLFGAATEGNVYYGKIVTTYAVNATLILHRGLAEPRIVRNVDKLALENGEYPVRVAAAIATRMPEIGEQISNPARIIIRQWLQETIKRRANSLRRALNVSWLRETAIIEIGKLTYEQLRQFNIEPDTLIVDRVVELLSSSVSWAETNAISDACGVRMASYYTSDQMEKILAAASDRSSDLIGAGGFDRVVKAVAKENAMGRAGVLELLEKHGLETDPLDEDADADEVIDGA
ncbi:hypothetical protein [Sphingomonas aerolata]|uniref:hypothetical protein n=1 Tax=Sphingomonas aerolata TaxID=185951 RepID=UPI003362BDA1